MSESNSRGNYRGRGRGGRGGRGREERPETAKVRDDQKPKPEPKQPPAENPFALAFKNAGAGGWEAVVIPA